MHKINKNRPLTRRDLLAAAGSGLALAACGRGGGDAAGDAMTFLAPLPLTTLTFAPELLADAAGFFADVGLSVDFQSTRGTAQAIQLVLAGGPFITRVGQIEVMQHVANQAAPIVNIATVVKESALRLVSSAADALQTPADLVGKVIGIPSEGGESETTLDLVIASAGLDPASVERQVVGVGPGVFNLVEQGRLAGFMVSIDTATILEAQMDAVVVMRPGEFIQSGSQVYIAAADDYAANEDMLRRYLQAITAALDFMIDDSGFDESIRIMRERHSFSTLQDDTVARESLAEYVRAWTAEGRENLLRTVPATWRSAYDELVRTGRIETGHDPGTWFNNALVAPR